MKILGLDPSLTNYGWVLLETSEEGDLLAVRARGRLQSKGEDFPDMVGRYVHMREMLRIVLRDTSPDGVGIENPVFGNSAMFKEGQFGLFLFALEVLKQERMDVSLWAPAQVKAYARTALDRPAWWKMKKSDMVEAVQVVMGDLPDVKDSKGRLRRWDHNEADAFHIGRLAAKFWAAKRHKLPPEVFSPLERKALFGSETARKLLAKGALARPYERYFPWRSDVREAARSFVLETFVYAKKKE